MKKDAAKGSFASLQDIFAEVAANARQDPIERLLILTYEFDDQQLVNLMAGRPMDDDFILQTNHLRFIANCRPVVIYDARKTREFSQLPHFLELLPLRSAPYSCHHSKAYLMVTRHMVRLVLGSFNLTQTGLFSNREVFMEFIWSDIEHGNAGVLRSFAALLREGYQDKAQAADSTALKDIQATLEQRMARWDGNGSAEHGKYSLITSGYAHAGALSGLKQLAALWATVSGQAPRKIIAVSPFFDRGSTFLIDALAQTLGPAVEVHLLTDADNLPALSKRHFGDKPVTARLHLIPKAIGAVEQARIAAANDGAQLADMQIARKLHAKILILCGPDGRHLLYMGSANFTSKAWNGDNHELGLAWVEQGDIEGIVGQVTGALAASSLCAYDGLPDRLPDAGCETDVLYADVAGYPDFIERIVLDSRDGRATVQFHFDSSTPDLLEQYQITWDGITIEPQQGYSQEIQWSKSLLPLLGKRNLRFTLRGQAEPEFNLPFYHAPELLDYADLLLYPTADDWLQHYLNPPCYGGSPGEHIPGVAPDTVPAAPPGVDRDSNVVIAMQRYLTSFSGAEGVFSERAAEIAQLPESADLCLRRIEEPITLYAKLLNEEREKSSGALRDQVHSFKLGELALFCNSLGVQLPRMKAFASILAQGLVSRDSDSAVLKIYLAFCRNELK